MTAYDIRVIGDPVLRQKANDVAKIDGALVKLVDDMLETMYAAPGIGLAAPQVGVNKRLFVWDIGYGPNAMVTPKSSRATVSGSSRRAVCRSPVCRGRSCVRRRSTLSAEISTATR